MAATRQLQLWKCVARLNWRIGGKISNRPGQSHRFISSVPLAKEGQFTAAKAASGYDLRKFEELVEKSSNFRPAPLPARGVENVIRLSVLNNDNQVIGESFVFNFGCIVSWDEAKDLDKDLRSLVRDSATGDLLDKTLVAQEVDCLKYKLSSSVPKFKQDSETLIFNSQQTEEKLTLMKLASSHILALSVNLAVLEQQQKTVVEQLEKIMSEGTNWPFILRVLTAHDFFRLWKINELCLEIFRLMFEVQAEPDLNDSVIEFYWEYADLDALRNRLLSHLEYRERVREMTKRLDFCLQCAQEHQDNWLAQRSLAVEEAILAFVACEIILFYLFKNFC